ncbi:MAG: biopolymer transporter ExbD [Pirellula sp.]|jgi:biopolymer transport protein ExbD
MSLSIRCPHCSIIRTVNPRIIGREIRCPTCDQPFRADESLLIHEGSTKPTEPSVAQPSTTPKPRDNDAQPPEASPPPLGSNNASTKPLTTPAAAKTPAAATSTSGLSAPEEEEPEQVTFAKKELPKDDMDMTPMVDVTFLLLIFFMITASFSSEKVFEKPPPLSDSPSTKPMEKPPEVYDSVRVQIDEFNAYTVIFPTGDQREASSKQDLLMALGEARAEVSTGKEDENLKLLIDAHEECIHAAIVAALDAGREKGFNSFSVTVVEEFE